MRKSLTASVFTTAILLSSAVAVVAAAYREFPLAITFAALADSTRGITGPGTYVHRAEGRIPTVLMNRNGQIQLDTRGSTREVCFNFDGAITVDLPDFVPADGCYPVLLRTLIRPGTVQIPDLNGGEALDFGLDAYWEGVAPDGRSYQYVVEYKRAEGNGVDITYAADSDTWTVSGVRPAKVSVYRKGKVSGWSVVGTYDLPVNFTAVRAN